MSSSLNTTRSGAGRPAIGGFWNARRRRLGSATTAILVVAVAGPFAFRGSGGIAANGHAQHGRSQPAAGAPTARPAKRVSPPFAANQVVLAMSFSDARHGWLLRARDCWGPACSVEVDGTNDGGRRWSRLASVPTCTKAAATCASVFAVRRIRRRIGVLLADDTFVTTDGGHHWARARVAGPLEPALAYVAGGAYVLTYKHTGCPGPCDVELARGDIGAHDFSSVGTYLSPSQGVGDDLAGAGHALYAIGYGRVAGPMRDAYSRLAVSTDLGRTWKLQRDPCRTHRGEVDAGAITAAGRYLALVCIPRETGTPADARRRASIVLSADGGRTFRRLHPPALGLGLEIALDARGDLALANGIIGGEGSYTYRLAVSYDTGRTWKVALTQRGSVAAHKRTPSLAIFGKALRWTTGTQTLWRSNDAGASWQSTTPP
jgi:hypothetical protein